MIDFNPSDHPHRRYNPLIGEWILVSPHRSKRPWKGGEEERYEHVLLPYDPECTLCPNNTRMNGEKNPNYASTFVFTNDFEAISPHTPEGKGFLNNSSLFHYESATGTCRVMCFSPKHNVTFSDMIPEEILGVIQEWKKQYDELGKRYKWVQVFENKGKLMGASNPHPHAQIWASDFLPTQITKEARHFETYFQKNNSLLLFDYLKEELSQDVRVIVENGSWIFIVPYWALWPFETILISRRHIQQMADMNSQEEKDLAIILKKMVGIYDSIFHAPFPYSMGWHNVPFDGEKRPYLQLHAHFYPPLLRSTTIKKFMVGYELLAENQRDLTPEQAADILKRLKNSMIE